MRYLRWLLTLLVGLMLLPAVAVAQGVAYVYDELGRLIAVTDPAGDTAIYEYDAVGNVLSIVRHASSVVSVIHFAPTSGPVGTTVTLYGTGFSATPSLNAVTFNGTAASVTSASSTQIVVTVPSGATSGVIAVTAPAGSAPSGTSFVVSATPAAAPTITGFSPTLADSGAAVTITGTSFTPAAVGSSTSFNVTQATIHCPAVRPRRSSPRCRSVRPAVDCASRLRVAKR